MWMIAATATATEMQNNFGRYLILVMSGQEFIVAKNGREVGRFIPKDVAVSYLTDSLTGILKEDYSLEKEKTERLTQKHSVLVRPTMPDPDQLKGNGFIFIAEVTEPGGAIYSGDFRDLVDREHGVRLLFHDLE